MMILCFPDPNKIFLNYTYRFSLSRLIVSYTMLLQMWEVITERDGIEVSYRWFPTKRKAEAFGLKLINLSASVPNT